MWRRQCWRDVFRLRPTSGRGAGAQCLAVAAGQGISGGGHRHCSSLTPAAGVAPRDARSSAETVATTRRNPMEVLHGVFQSHPSALRLHRALTIALASGNAEEAADTAAALAQTVARVLLKEATEQRGSGSTHSETKADGSTGTDETPPPATPDDLLGAVEAAQRAALRGAAGERNPNPGADGGSPHPETSFWRSTGSLTVTLLESAFETELPEGDADADPASLSEAGSAALAHEQEQMTILEEYLDKEKDRWKAQKDAVAKTVLDVARSVGLTPIDLHVAEHGTAGVGERGHLNVLRHANVIIRGEVPSIASTAATSPTKGVVRDNKRDDNAAHTKMEEELQVLKERMRLHFQKELTAQEERMARYELLLANTTMRYVVGLHKEVQLALNHSEAVTKAREALTQQGGLERPATNADFFIQQVLAALHRPPESSADRSSDGNELAETLARPVLPFTFMLKCCLWFTTRDE